MRYILLTHITDICKKNGQELRNDYENYKSMYTSANPLPTLSIEDVDINSAEADDILDALITGEEAPPSTPSAFEEWFFQSTELTETYHIRGQTGYDSKTEAYREYITFMTDACSNQIRSAIILELPNEINETDINLWSWN